MDSTDLIIQELEEVPNLVSSKNSAKELYGKFPKQYKINIDEHILPFSKSPLSISGTLIESAKRNIDDLLENGLIVKVERPQVWITNYVHANDNSNCLNPVDLNKILLHENVEIPDIKKARSQLSGNEFYTVVNYENINWQIELEKDSCDLLTFNSGFGFYKFKRLPYGLSITPEISQKYMNEYFSELPGVFVAASELIVFGNNETEHDRNLQNVFNKAEEISVNFCSKNIEFSKSELKYGGYIFTKYCTHFDTNRVKIISTIKVPENKVEFKKLFGMINYLCMQEVPGLIRISKKIRNLELKNNFTWSADNLVNFDNIKNIISTSTLYKIISSTNEPIFIQCHTSKDILSCCIFQNTIPMAYGAANFTPIYDEYSKIEKDCMCISYATHKFSNLINRRNITIYTNNKILINVFEKDLDVVYSIKLRQMIVKLLKFNIKIEFIPDEYLEIANALTNCCKPTEGFVNFNYFSENCDILKIDETILIDLQRETKNDIKLTKLLQYIVNGWPDCEGEVDKNLKPYYKLREDIYYDNQLIKYKNIIVVPEILKPSITNYIETTEDVDESLFAWQETLERSFEIQKLPFFKVGIDILTSVYDNIEMYFLVLVDYYTKWIEIYYLDDLSDFEIIYHLMDIFSKYGYPKEIVANGTYFDTTYFNEFARKNNIDVIFEDSLKLSNQTVVIIEKLIHLYQENKNQFFEELFQYRNTPIVELGHSPSGLLFKQRLVFKNK